jgi:hypothetical protein
MRNALPAGAKEGPVTERRFSDRLHEAMTRAGLSKRAPARAVRLGKVDR